MLKRQKAISKNIKLISVVGIAASLSCISLSASAFTAKVSGQVDRALTYANNGSQWDAASVDNNASNSRFRFTGIQQVDPGLKLGMVYEIGLDQMPSTSWDINQNSNGSVHLDSRKMDTYLEGRFGRFSFGKGNGAAFMADAIDMSGTAFLGGGVWYELYGYSIHFVDNQGNSLYKLGKTQSPFNAIGRQNRIRYDSPSINGLVLSGSFDNGHAYELAARYKHALGGGAKFAAGASWTDTEKQDIETNPANGVPAGGIIANQKRRQILNGAASLLLADGLNFTVSYGHEKTLQMANAGTSNQTGYDAKNLFGGVGYILGKHHFSVNYGETRDLPADGVKGSQVGAAYVYDWRSGVQLFASYHMYMLDIPQQIKAAKGWGSAQNISQVYIGTRIKFM